ncbi:MAG: hypothetical protein WD060_04945 [Pirellulales bacterium]
MHTPLHDVLHESLEALDIERVGVDQRRDEGGMMPWNCGRAPAAVSVAGRQAAAPVAGMVIGVVLGRKRASSGDLAGVRRAWQHRAAPGSAAQTK